MMDEKYRGLLVIVAIIIAAILAYGVLNMKDNRNGAERIGDAIHELPQGLDKAERQLEDRSPGQKLGDTVKDAGDKIKENTEPK